MIRLVKKLADGVAILANAVGTLVVLMLIAVVNYDIIARSVFGKPFLGAVEVVQFSMVLIVFLQLPDVVRVGRLTRSDGFLTLLNQNRARASDALRRIIDLVSAVFMALIVYAMWPEFLDMYETRDYFGVPGVFTAPWWPVKLVIVCSAALCVAHFVLHSLIGSQPDRSGNARGATR